LFDPAPHNKSLKAIAQHHAIPGKPCIGYELFEKGRFSTSKLMKPID
jgi:hypothetical protein